MVRDYAENVRLLYENKITHHCPELRKLMNNLRTGNIDGFSGQPHELCNFLFEKMDDETSKIKNIGNNEERARIILKILDYMIGTIVCAPYRQQVLNDIHNCCVNKAHELLSEARKQNMADDIIRGFSVCLEMLDNDRFEPI